MNSIRNYVSARFSRFKGLLLRGSAPPPPPLLTTVDSAAAKSTAASTKSITAALKNLSLIGSTWKHVWSGTYYLLEIFKRMAFRSLSAKRLPHLLDESRRVFRIHPLLSGCSASFSTGIVGDDPVLVRDFIRSALYDPNHGYFSQRSGSVGVLEQSIRFNQLQGRKAYMQQLDRIYKQSDISWFTPVELFKPWYAHGIAEAILRTTNLSVPLKIFEIGGGSGTCAKGILDYIMLNAPERIYNNMTYTSVEISPTLAERQLQTVGEVRSHLSKFNVERRDAADRGGWGNVEQQPCWVIMLEVMREALAELYKPLQDPLITRCADIVDLDGKNNSRRGPLASAVRNMWAKIFPKPRRCWLPTGCLKLMEVLHGTLPKMSLIASDFSFLPDVKIPGDRAPLVSTKKDGTSSDYSSYLDAKGDADIFFPTDFWLLERIDHHCSGWRKQHDNSATKKGKKRRTIMLDTSSFMEEFGVPAKTKTKDGYNPLLDDFKNTKFYLSVPTHNTK
ncbi:unnamed protein product [Rhodiola kirilowii]